MKLRAQIGIEISSTEVRGASVRAAGGAPELAALASAPIPPGAIDADGLPDAHVLADVVRQVAARLDAKAASVVVGASSCNLVARVMEIPPVPDNEVRAVLRGEMDHFRILPAGQSAFDFHRMPELPRPPGEQPEEPVSRVLLMGAEERAIAGLRDVVAGAGLSLVSVEPGSLAALRAAEPLLRSDGTVATVAVNPSRTDIFVTQQGELCFYRQVETGVADLRLSMAGQQQTETGRRPVGGLLVMPDEPADEPEEPRFQSSEKPCPYNRQAIQLLMTEVERSIEYFMRECPQARDDMHVRFAVDAPDALEIVDLFGRYLSLRAEPLDIRTVISAAAQAADLISTPDGGRFLAAVGLALRGASGDYALAPSLNLAIADRVVVEGRVAPRFLALSFGLSAVVLVGTVVAAMLVNGAIGRAERIQAQKKTELSAVTAEHEQLVSNLQRQATLATAIQSRNRPIKEAVEFLAAAVSPRACLKSLAVAKGGSITLTGEALSPRTVADMMDMINLSPAVEPVRLTTLTSLSGVGAGPELRFELQTAFAMKPAATTTASTKPSSGGGGS